MKMHRIFLVTTIAALLFLICFFNSTKEILAEVKGQNGSGYQGTEDAEYVKGEILIKFKPGRLVREKLESYEKEKELNENSQEPRLQKTEPEKAITLGISSVDMLFAKHSVKQMERVFRMAKVPDADGTILFKGERKRVPDLTTIYKLTVPKEADILSIIQEFQNDPNIEYAEPNYIYHTLETIPNEYADRAALTAAQWALDKIQAPEAWDIETGISDVIIGIIDTGVDWDHPDLAANIWTNTGEDDWSDPNDPTTGNGIDDDGNGYIDDWKGWDFVSVPSGSVYPGEDPVPPDNNPMDFDGHGTCCSGIAGAVTNNGVGVAGLNWNSKIMALRAGYKGTDGGGYLQTSDIAPAITYAADKSTNVINMSFGSQGSSYTMKQALDYAYSFDCVLVASAGNENTSTMSYPAAYENVIAVSATDDNDNRASFSNFGSWVDVAAPGSNVYSTYFDNTYTQLSGTSMAAPYVSGLAGLVLSKNPTFTNYQIKNIILSTADPVSSAVYIGTGRINAYRAVQSGLLPVAEISSPNQNGIIKSTINIIGSAYGTDFQDYVLEYGAGENPTSWNVITSSSSAINNGVIGTWNTSSLSGINTLRLTVNNTTGQSVSVRTTVLIDQMIQNGWPVTIDEMTTGAPAIDDLDLDGQLEVVVASLNKLTVYNFDGTVKSGWPVVVGDVKFYDQDQYITPALGDLDGDGDLEIVIGFNTLETEFPGGGGISLSAVYAFHHDGTVVNGWPFENGYCKTAAIGDIDGDGDPEIVFTGGLMGGMYKMWVLHHDGTTAAGWPQDIVASESDCSPALGDIDGDGDVEVLGADRSGRIYAWHHNGMPVSGWPQQMEGGSGQDATQTPILADLDGYGAMEIIAGSDGSGTVPAGVYVWNADGTLKTGWPQRVGINYGYIQECVVGDVDGDGDLEIVATCHFTYDSQSLTNTDAAILIWHHDGTNLSGWPIEFLGRNGRVNIFTCPVLGDINSDGDVEIITGINHHDDVDQDNWWEVGENIPKMYAWHHNANEVNGWPKLMIGNYGIQGRSCVLTDLDNDGDSELLSTLSHNLGGSNFNSYADIYVWDCSGSFDANNIEWGTLQKNNQRTGLYAPIPVTKPLAILENPENDAVLEGSVSVTGTAAGAIFSDYNLEYGEGETPATWNLINSSSSPVENDVLGVWNTSGLKGNYTIRLTVNSTIGTSSVQSIHAFTNLYLTGWPKTLLGQIFSAPISVDIDKDGDNDLVVFCGSGSNTSIHVFDHNGSEVSGWPQSVTGKMSSSSAIADIDNDGFLEILGAHRHQGKLYIWNHDGTQLDGWPQSFEPHSNSNEGMAPVVGDLEGDGDLEILIPTSQKVYAWHHDGTLVDGWPTTTAGDDFSLITLGDIEGDGDLEAFVYSSGNFYGWHHDGTNVSGWPKSIQNWSNDPPVLGDLDGDGNLEILIHQNLPNDRLNIWNHDGTDFSPWPSSSIYYYGGYLSLADIDKDNDLEIFTGCEWGGTYGVHAYHHDGTVVTGWPANESNLDSNPAVGDITGDGNLDVVQMTGNSFTGRIFAWDKNGTDLNSWNRPINGRGRTYGFFFTPLLDDLDNDGDIEVITYSNLGYFDSDTSRIYIYDENGSYVESNIEWGMFRHDLCNSGNYSFKSLSYTDSEPVSVGPTISFNEGGSDLGDGRAIDMAFTSLSGSGNVTVQQTNASPSNSPCANVCSYRWDMSKDAGITAFSTDLSFHYTDADATGYTESTAYFGIAKYNSSTNTWQWLGGTVDADNNKITVNGVTSFSTFTLFRRIFGDCTDDGYVDAADFQHLGDCWHQTSSGEFTESTDARFFNYNKNTDSGNQIIDAADFQVFGDCWHNGVAP